MEWMGPAKIGVLLVACLAALSSLTVISVKAAPLTWSVETVDAANNVGSYSSLALDSNGYPHISYRDEYWNDLKYAEWTGSTWAIAPVDTVGNVGLYTSLALDSNDYPHISYYDFDDYDLEYVMFYTTVNMSVWITASVDTAGDVGAYSSIATDSLDRPHISYVDLTNDALKYAGWNGSDWAIDTIFNPPGYVFDTSLVLDSNDRPHISCGGDVLKYAWWTGSSWNVETVENIPTTSVSLALDSNSYPHISYYDVPNYDLKYAGWNGSTWTIETVDASYNVGKFCSIALDSSDHPHISYYDGYWQDLKYAVWNGTEWFIKNLDSVGDVGNWGTSIALDSSDHPHISYHDFGNGNLKYARDPDEYFYSVDHASFDSNGDSFHDGVEVWMDVDTTYPGSLNISVQGFLTDEYGTVHSSNVSNWSISGASEEYGYVHLYLPEDSPEGLYNIGVALYDERHIIEDGRIINEAAYLYQPNMQQLTVQVTGSGTTSPAPNVWWGPQDTEVEVTAFPDSGWTLYYWSLDSEYAGSDNPITVMLDTDHVLTAVFIEEFHYGWLMGTVTDVQTSLPIAGANVTGTAVDSFFAETNSSGQYKTQLRPGTYNVTAEKLGYQSATVISDVFFNTTTIQDFALLSFEPSTRELAIEVHGEGVTFPTPGVHLFPEGTLVAVEAFPLYGWTLDHWVLDEVNVGDVNPLNLAMDTDHALLAVFAEKPLPLHPEIESCNPDGVLRNYYNLGEAIYVTGASYPPSQSFSLYIVEDVTLWIDGMLIPTRVTGTATMISSNVGGHIVPTNVWLNPQIEGKFDILVDVNNNGQYDLEADALDDDDVEVTAGFVIPEFPALMILPLFITATLLAAIYSRRKRALLPSAFL